MDLGLRWISTMAALVIACGGDDSTGDDAGGSSTMPTSTSAGADGSSGASATVTTAMSGTAGSDGPASSTGAGPDDTSGGPATTSSTTGPVVDCHRMCPDDPDGHTCCNDAYGFLYFCNDDGTCTMASGCESLECCLPGPTGDNWCQTNFGPGSTCEIVGDDGRCTQ